MRTLAREIDGMNLPAVEKISSEHAEDPFRILIGTLLSARTQDETTHAASSRLFRAAPTPAAVSALGVKRIEKLIFPVGFYRSKARFVKATADAVQTRFGGVVPSTLDELVTLPGVGRKTANLVMIVAFQSADHICVDIHVHRITNRLGWVTTSSPEETEQALYAAIDRRWWASLNRYLVTWGQNVCRPLYPRCEECAVADECPRIGVERVGKARPNLERMARGA
jgi:endonuclease-3